MGYAIRKYREKMFPGRGGQAKCAKALGITPQTWSQYEKASNLHQDTLEKIAAFFGVTVVELRDEGTPPSAGAAGKRFSPGMVQAAMGHRSRKSAEAYFHPTEEMAAEVRQKIITELSQSSRKTAHNASSEGKAENHSKGEFACPCCRHNLLIINKKSRKPLRLAAYEILERAKGIEPS